MSVQGYQDMPPSSSADELALVSGVRNDRNSSRNEEAQVDGVPGMKVTIEEAENGFIVSVREKDEILKIYVLHSLEEVKSLLDFEFE